jgi:hypothetical protein
MNHNIHNVYIELYDAGVYPEWVVNQSEAARTYEPQAYSLVVETLKKVHVLILVFSHNSLLNIFKIIIIDHGMML